MYDCETISSFLFNIINIYIFNSRCKERIRLYTCPRCGIGYCGSDCYKSFSHIDCSESFYKQCVEEELKSQEHEPALKQKMVDILKRIHETDVDDILQEDTYEEDSPLDSDDEEEVNIQK